MPAGLQIINDSNLTQISSDQSNFFMVEKGVQVVPAPPGSPPNYERPYSNFTISPTVDYDTIAVACSEWVSVNGIGPSLLPGGTASRFTMARTGGTVYWYAFRSYRSLTPRATGVGLEIYNADTSVAFADNYPKLMKYYGKIPVPSSTTVNTSVPTSGVSLAFLSYGSHYGRASKTWDDPEGPGTITRNVPHSLAIKWTSGNVAADGNQVARSTIASSAASSYLGGIIVIDVTGY